jgi:hypothetical protein
LLTEKDASGGTLSAEIENPERSDVDHFASLVKSRVLSSERVPVATYCCVVPLGMA